VCAWQLHDWHISLATAAQPLATVVVNQVSMWSILEGHRLSMFSIVPLLLIQTTVLAQSGAICSSDLFMCFIEPPLARIRCVGAAVPPPHDLGLQFLQVACGSKSYCGIDINGLISCWYALAERLDVLVNSRGFSKTARCDVSRT